MHYVIDSLLSVLLAATTSLKGVGQSLADKLATLHIYTLEDLIFHLPYRYQDRTQASDLGALAHNQDALICAQIEASSVVFGRRRSLVAKVSDGTGFMTLRWFYFNHLQQKKIIRGNWIVAFGTTRIGAHGAEIVHPEYRITTDEPSHVTTDRLTPIYPLTEGIGQARMRNLIEQAMSRLNELNDYLQATPLSETLPDLVESLTLVHSPPKEVDVQALLEGSHPSQQRLATEELLAHHLSLLKLKSKRRRNCSPQLIAGEITKQFTTNLPFSLTAAQQRVSQEIKKDLQSAQTMQRLVQGDVGSGKTIVAALAGAQCVDNAMQVAVMAPTELLAEQHFKNFKSWFETMGVQVEWLSGKLNTAQKKAALANIESSRAQIIVGTHALFQDSVKFGNLGLIIVDEQHRFGVNQRLALIEKAKQSGLVAHQLAMTATPIPRTLAMIFYADMDVSSIDELPPGRAPVETIVLADSRCEQVIERVANACQSGRQAYWVCPLIDESEAIQAQAATDRYEQLKSDLPSLSIGLIHGRMSSDEKNLVMSQFRDNKIAVLVATTVIEVGVDVPNASLMIIENAERLGLAQLHQLRGRVGRGDVQSCCVLMYHAPLGLIAKKRLTVMRDTQDGFEIAQHDLELRGPGELLGTRQTGLQQLKVADLVRDRALIPGIEKLAQQLIKQSPQSATALIARWVKNKEHYADV